ncbi:MAG: crossover junction endodeoxyribonuclease RuvC [Pseudomonadota bacterium]
MKVIGVDPGLASTGVAIACGDINQITHYAYGTIRTPAGMHIAQRLCRIFNEFGQVLKQEQNVELIVIEDVFSLEKYPCSGITLGKVCGVIHLAGSLNSIPTIELPTKEVKKALTGNGNATKAQVEKSVRHILKATTPIRSAHAADALSLALVGLFRSHKAIGMT